MNSHALFVEKQRFNQWWIWTILISVNAVMLFGLAQQMVFKKPFGENPASDGGIIFGAFMCSLLLIVFVSFRLETKIYQGGIAVRFFPLQLKTRYFAFEDISSMEIREYKPIMEFGGWGIRGFGSNRALNIKGKIGLQLVFKNGQKLLIGTQKAPEIVKILAPLKNM
ncbi:MAG: hypothetical protein NWR50_05200 [Crocinitomicaceae bacterium]|nr:hypothetical protein [Crocinitomicaceae bacterium]